MKITLLLLTLIIIMTNNPNDSYSQNSNDFISINSDVKYQYFATYDTERLNKIMNDELSTFCEFKQSFTQAKYPLKLYKVIYKSVIPELNNKPTECSGLIAIPETGKTSMPMISYQHGTVFTNYEVPTNPESSYETRLELAGLAGQGYILIAADYFGKGISKEPEAYLVKESAKQVCYDMYIASLEVLKHLGYTPTQFFLSGWSQGSFNTLAFLNKLESLGVDVTAVSIASTPSDLFAIVNRWVFEPKPIDAIYLPGLLALKANSFEIYYNEPGLSKMIIKPEYWQISNDLFTNKITWEEFDKVVPEKIPDYINPEFKKLISNQLLGYGKILSDAEVYRWRSKTPVNTYFGEIDEVIPEYIARLPEGYQDLMGGNVTAVSAGPKADHRGTFVFSVNHQLNWFNSLLK